MTHSQAAQMDASDPTIRCRTDANGHALCAKCGGEGIVEGYPPWGCTIACDCYDGAPDSRSFSVSGESIADAWQQWDDAEGGGL